MKRSFKKVLITFMLCATSVFAVIASGCGATDKIKDKINQIDCEHVWDAGEETKQATCQEAGEFTKTCTLCDATDKTPLAKIDHVIVSIAAVTPTCTNTGLTEGRKCAMCNTVVVKQETVSALGHSVMIMPSVSATCLESGLTEGSKCGRCNVIFEKQQTIPATGHTMIELAAYDATCETTGFTGGVKCENCDVILSGEVLEALGHEWSDWVEETAATCTEDGYKERTCTREGCDGVEQETLPALGHSLGAVTTIEEKTCDTNGEYSQTCETCQHVESWIVETEGHFYGAEGTCNYCGSAEAYYFQYAHKMYSELNLVANFTLTTPFTLKLVTGAEIEKSYNCTKLYVNAAGTEVYVRYYLEEAVDGSHFANMLIYSTNGGWAESYDYYVDFGDEKKQTNQTDYEWFRENSEVATIVLTEKKTA